MATAFVASGKPDVASKIRAMEKLRDRCRTAGSSRDAERAREFRLMSYCRRTPVGVIRFRSSLRSARTVLENAILTAVFTVVLTGVVYTSEVVQWV